ncbi:hypothetical protein EON65_42850, partial [archaeon]
MVSSQLSKLIISDEVLMTDLLNVLLELTGRRLIGLSRLNLYELVSLASRLTPWPTHMVPLGQDESITRISNDTKGTSQAYIDDVYMYTGYDMDEVCSIVGNDYFPVLGRGHRPPAYRPLSSYPFSKVHVHSSDRSGVVYSGVSYFEVTFHPTSQSRAYAAERERRQLNHTHTHTDTHTHTSTHTTETNIDNATISLD